MKFGRITIKKHQLGEFINFPLKPQDPEPENGNWAFIYRGKASSKIAKIYGRDPETTCLKIFKIIHDGDDYIWGPTLERGSDLFEATMIQNVMSLYGLAPRVYALFYFEQHGLYYLAQLTEYMGKHEFTLNKDQDAALADEYMDQIDIICEQHHFINKLQDRRAKNIVNGKWVDFQGFALKEDYKDRLTRKVDEILNWHPPHSYQTIDELGLGGRRDMDDRVKKLGLDKMDFKGKSLVDVGCSAGWFMAYATQRGAKRVVGLELPERANLAAEVNYYLGYFNHDFVGIDIKEQTYIAKLDIVLFLSMSYHVGLPDWVLELCREIFVYEGNARDSDAHFIERMKEYFPKTESIGTTDDLSIRQVVWGIK